MELERTSVLPNLTEDYTPGAIESYSSILNQSQFGWSSCCVYILTLRIHPSIDAGMLPKPTVEFRCPKCGLTYNRDLNSAINIALNKGMGWGSCETELPDEVLARSQDRTEEAP